MKRIVLAMTVGAVLLTACDRSVKAPEGSNLAPKADDFTLTTVMIDGKACRLAYAYYERNMGTNQATGGPVVLNLGCEGR